MDSTDAVAAPPPSPIRRPHPITSLLRRAGWAPAAVYLGHLAGSRGLDIYAVVPWFDEASHFAGGMAIAWFVAEAAAIFALGSVTAPLRLPIHAALIVGGTSLAILLWEVQEFAQDRLLGTRFQSGVADTMWDVILGFAGCALYLALAAARRTLGWERTQ